MTAFVIKSTEDGRNRFFQHTKRLNSNRQILRPADDPIAAKRAIDHHKMMKELETMSTNQGLVRSELLVADVTLMDASGLVKEALELAIQMASDAFNAGDRAAAANRIVEIRQELLSLANRQQPNGRYLFGGVNDSNPPYDPVTGAYLGSNTNREVEIAPSYHVAATLTGAESFGDPEVIYSTLQNLATALTGNNMAGIQASIDGIQTAISDFAIAQAEVGSRLNAVSSAELMVDDLSTHFELRRGELRDVDIPSEITKLKASEAALQASIDVSRQLLEVGLMSWR